MLDRLVLAIGLHLHQLVAELGEAALLDGHFLFDGAPRVLILGEPGLGGRDAVVRELEAGFEGFLALGLVGEPAGGVVGGRIEPLQGDQAFEVWVHRPK